MSLISQEFRDEIEHLIKDWNSSDFILAVIRKDKDGNHFQEEYASFGRNSYDPRKTMFSIASNSKQFTVLSVSALMNDPETKKYFPQRWQTPLQDVFPNFRLADDFATQHLTFEDAFCHRSGIPRHDLVLGGQDGMQDLLQGLKHLTPSMEIRENMQYNNQFYNIMTLLPENLKNQSYPDFLEEKIFSKAGFERTTYSIAQAKKWGLIKSYFPKNLEDKTLQETASYFMPDQQEISLTAGAGGILSCAEDLTKWLRVMLSDGERPDTLEVVVEEETLKLLRRPRIPAWVASGPDFPEVSERMYGLGKTTYSYRGHLVYEHGGDLPGHASQMTYLPNDGIGLVLFSNDGSSNGATLHTMIKYLTLDRLLGLKSIDWNSRFHKKAEKELEEERERLSTPPTEDLHTSLAEQSIKYHNPVYGTFTLEKFELEQPDQSTITDAGDAKAIADWVSSMPRKYSTYALIRIDKLFAKYLLLWAISKNTYKTVALSVYDLEGGKGKVVAADTRPNEVVMEKDGLVFGGNFWGAEEKLVRPLKDTSKGQVYFERI